MNETRNVFTELKPKQKSKPKQTLGGCIITVVSLAVIFFIVKSCVFGSNKIGIYEKQELPEGFEYNIVEHDINTHINHLSIDINQKISVGQLATLAEKLDNYKSKTDKLYISYLVTGMPKGVGYWAVSNFEPDLEIDIMGSTTQEDKKNARFIN